MAAQQQDQRTFSTLAQPELRYSRSSCCCPSARSNESEGNSMGREPTERRIQSFSGINDGAKRRLRYAAWRCSTAGGSISFESTSKALCQNDSTNVPSGMAIKVYRTSCDNGNVALFRCSVKVNTPTPSTASQQVGNHEQPRERPRETKRERERERERG